VERIARASVKLVWLVFSILVATREEVTYATKETRRTLDAFMIAIVVILVSLVVFALDVY
jgi:hypothetical protein